jgi:uncharacterized peroxidase-related enzyme
MSRLNPIDPAQAEGKAKSLLDAVQQKLGITPNILRTMANAPAALEAYLGFNQALAGASLDSKTRESIALTVAGANGCDYCASAHTALGGMLGIPAGELSANLAGRSDDERLNAILHFANAVVAKRGWVNDTEVAALRAAGLGDGEITEIIATVAFNIFTNYFNHIAQTDVDFPLVETTKAAA